MNLPDARKLAQEVVDGWEGRIGKPLTIVESGTRQIEGGWVFHWTSRDSAAPLVGQGPLVILKDGRVLEGGSAEQPEDVLHRFGLIGAPRFEAEVEWAAWKGSRHTAGGAEYRAMASLEAEPSSPRYAVALARTPMRSVWRIRFDGINGPHEQLHTGVRIILFEGRREAGRARLRDKARLCD